MTCPRCGGKRLVEGKLMGGTSVRFRPTRLNRFWTLKNGAKTMTYACLSCGFITTVIDPDHLRRLIGPGDPGSAAT
jgi:DNA-directed RNA polymerase subunit RPC12/RpoP